MKLNEDTAEQIILALISRCHVLQQRVDDEVGYGRRQEERRRELGEEFNAVREMKQQLEINLEREMAEHEKTQEEALALQGRLAAYEKMYGPIQYDVRHAETNRIARAIAAWADKEDRQNRPNGGGGSAFHALLDDYRKAYAREKETS